MGRREKFGFSFHFSPKNKSPPVLRGRGPFGVNSDVAVTVVAKRGVG